MSAQQSITPMGLRKEAAAAYVGLPTATFERAVSEGRFHKPRQPTPRTAVWIRSLLDEDLLKLPESTILPPENTGAAKPRK